MKRAVFCLVLLPLLASCGLGLCAGTSVCDGGPAVLSFTSGASLDLGARGFGHDHSVSITIANSGGYVAADINAQTLPADFSWRGGAFPGLSGTCSEILVAGSSCSLDVVYRPRPPQGPATGQLVIDYFDGSAMQTVSLEVRAERDNGSFTRAMGADGLVYAVLPQSDGSIFVGGAFTNYRRESAPYFMKVLKTGARAPSFSIGTGFNGAVRTVVQASDRLYVGGAFTSINGTTANRIVCLTLTGEVDATFNPGTGADNGTVYSIAQATDGSGDLYVGGDFTSWNGLGRNRIVRIDSNGTLDAGFVVGTGFNAVVRAILPTLSGTAVYVGGDFTTFKGSGAVRLARVLTNGNLDGTFDTTTGFSAIVVSLARREGAADIYAAGSFTTFKGTTTRYWARISDTATLSATSTLSLFSGIGQTVVAAGDGSGAAYLGISTGTSSNNLYKISDAGVAGGLLMGVNYQVIDLQAIAPAADGSTELILGGRSNNPAFDGVARFDLSTNTIPSDFPHSTGFLDSNSAFNLLAIAATRDGTGDIYVAGRFSNYDGTDNPAIMRLTASGEKVETFLTEDWGGYNDDALALLGQADGHVLMGGEDFSGTVVANYFTRFDATGAVDVLGFSSVGGPIYQLAETAAGDGSFYIGGSGTYGGSTSYLNRVSATGARDTSFTPNIDNFLQALEVIDDGAVYIGGAFLNVNGTGRTRIARLLPSGATDPAFTPLGGFNGAPLAIAKATDGSGDIYVTGNFTQYRGAAAPYIIRLNSDGSPDAAFAVGSGLNNIGRKIAVDAEGNVYVGGDFTTYQGNPQSGLAKLSPDGSRASGFPTGNLVNGQVTALMLAADTSGDIYLGGTFLSYNGTTAHNLIRIDANGTLE